MYQIKVPGAARKDIKGLSKSAQKELAKHLDKLSLHPKAGEPLHGVLKGFWKYAFSLKAAEYRIAYQIFPADQLIILIMVGSRENFYKRLQRRL